MGVAIVIYGGSSKTITDKIRQQQTLCLLALACSLAHLIPMTIMLPPAKNMKQ